MSGTTNLFAFSTVVTGTFFLAASASFVKALGSASYLNLAFSINSVLLFLAKTETTSSPNSDNLDFTIFYPVKISG